MKQTLKNPAVFPAGTTVKAYPQSNWTQRDIPPTGAPKGVAVAEAVVAGDGTATLTGLTAGVQYWAAAEVGGSYVYVHFTAIADVVAPSEPGNAGEVGKVLKADDPAITLNVKSYGAIGDGLTDDAAAIRKANEAVAAAGGGTVLFPAGEYRVASNIALASKVEVRGVAQGSVVIKPDVGVTTAPFVGTGVEDVAVRDLTINGNAAVFSANIYGLNFSKCTRVRVSGVRIRNTYHIGVYCSECTDVVITENRLQECGKTSTGPNAIHITKGSRVRVGLNEVVDWGNSEKGRAIFVATESHGTEIIGNDISNPDNGDHSHMISVEGSDRCIISDNQLDNFSYTGTSRKCMGISVLNGNDALIASNRIRQPVQDNGSFECIQVDGTSARATITGNHCEFGDDNGITAWGAGEHVVTGNYVQFAAHHGISINGKNCTVTGNVVKNSGIHGLEGITPSGIGILTGISGCVVVGNRCFDDQAEKTQRWGVLETGTANENTILGNDLRGNKEGAISYVGAATVVGANLGQTARKGEVELHNIGAASFADSFVSASVAPPLGTMLYREDTGQIGIRTGSNTYTPIAKDKTSSITDAAELTPNYLSGSHFIIAGTRATRKIKNVANRVQGATVTFDIKNESGGATATTWEENFKLAGAWVDPANGKSRTITFYCYDGTNWKELGRSAADI